MRWFSSEPRLCHPCLFLVVGTTQLSRSVDATCRRWWPRQREIVAAVDPTWLAVEIAPVAGAGLAPERFHPLMGDLLALLLPAMRGEIEQFSLDSRRPGFLASNLNTGLTES